MPKAGRPQSADLFGKDVQHNDNGDKRERRNGGKRQSVYVLVLLGRRRGEYERGVRETRTRASLSKKALQSPSGQGII